MPHFAPAGSSPFEGRYRAVGGGPLGIAETLVTDPLRVLGEMVLTPTWRDIAERSQFTTTFMVGDEFQNFLAETQADVAAAIAEERR